MQIGFFQTPVTARPQYIALLTLLAAGLLLGVTTNMARLAHSLAIQPLPYLTWSLLGAAAILFAVSVARGEAGSLNRRTLEYFVVAGFLTSAAANLIFFNAVARLGVSFVAMMIALPPLFTYVGALLLRMERFSWRRVAGVLLALAGTALLVVNRWVAREADIAWLLLTLMGPVLLAAGNLYRSRRWPTGASPQSLAPGMLIAASALLVVYAVVAGESLQVSLNGVTGVLLIAVQSIFFAAQFLLMFILQRVGGPVFLSLMGGVSAILGVPMALWLFSEPMLPGFVTSAILVAMGIACLLATRQPNPQSPA